MLKLSKSLEVFGSAAFNQILKQELCAFDINELPLQSATTQGGLVDDKPISISVFSSFEHEQFITVKMAIFFEEIVAGCSCGDPMMNIHNNCDLELEINKKTAQVKFNFI